ncbi:MAG TPA: MFS transporter [Chthonomonadales bacterium]|nr:MFS transporter [Chthonomonadales bacterium]
MTATSNHSRGETGPANPPIDPLPRYRALLYSVANLGGGAFYSFNNYVLPLFLSHYTRNAVVLGLMGSTHSVEGAVIQPVVGNASDRLRSPWGRRRPFMLVFMLLSALFLGLTPLGALAAPSARLPLMVAAIFLFTVTFNIAFDPYQALMPDITPPAQRGRVQGLWALAGNLAQACVPLMVFLLRLPLADSFLVVAAAMALTMVTTCIGITEPRDLNPVPRVSLGSQMVDALSGLHTLKQAGLAIVVFSIAGAGIGAVTPTLTLFVKTITHCSDQTALMMAFVLMLSTAAFVGPAGILTDRIGPKKVVELSFALIAAAAIGALWIHTVGQVALIMGLAGLGNAAQAAAAYPLLTDLVPAEEVGFYTGFQSTALSLVQPVTVFFTGLLINLGGHNYRVVFLVLAMCMALAGTVLTQVDQGRAVHEIRKRDTEMGRRPSNA